ALLVAAGPYAGARRDATARSAMIALLDRISRSPFPAFGRALLTLARGDSAQAVTALRQAAQELPTDAGRTDVLLLAGQVCAELGPQGEATAAVLFAEVVRSAGPGAAPAAAELAWAHLLRRRGDAATAVQHLEHLILTYPESAVVPQARRELDQAKGA